MKITSPVWRPWFLTYSMNDVGGELTALDCPLNVLSRSTYNRIPSVPTYGWGRAPQLLKAIKILPPTRLEYSRPLRSPPEFCCKELIVANRLGLACPTNELWQEMLHGPRIRSCFTEYGYHTS
jgi:hypothetical protein